MYNNRVSVHYFYSVPIMVLILLVKVTGIYRQVTKLRNAVTEPFLDSGYIVEKRKLSRYAGL